MRTLYASREVPLNRRQAVAFWVCVAANVAGISNILSGLAGWAFHWVPGWVCAVQVACSVAVFISTELAARAIMRRARIQAKGRRIV
jgi:fatty acid desaturase